MYHVTQRFNLLCLAYKVEALVQYLIVCPQYATLQLYARVCAGYRHLTVSPGAH